MQIRTIKIRLFRKTPLGRIVLLKDIEGLGFQGQEINVKRGYARNHLIPKNFAVLATKENKEKFLKSFTALEQENMNQILADHNRLKNLNKIKLNYLVDVDTTSQVTNPISLDTIKQDLLKRAKLIEGDVLDESIPSVKQIGDTYLVIHTAKQIDAKIRIRLIRKKTDLKKYLQKIKEKDKDTDKEITTAEVEVVAEDEDATLETDDSNLEYEDEENAVEAIKVTKESPKNNVKPDSKVKQQDIKELKEKSKTNEDKDTKLNENVQQKKTKAE